MDLLSWPNGSATGIQSEYAVHRQQTERLPGVVHLIEDYSSWGRAQLSSSGDGQHQRRGDHCRAPRPCRASRPSRFDFTSRLVAIASELMSERSARCGTV